MARLEVLNPKTLLALLKRVGALVRPFHAQVTRNSLYVGMLYLLAEQVQAALSSDLDQTSPDPQDTDLQIHSDQGAAGETHHVGIDQLNKVLDPQSELASEFSHPIPAAPNAWGSGWAVTQPASPAVAGAALESGASSGSSSPSSAWGSVGISPIGMLGGWLALTGGGVAAAATAQPSLYALGTVVDGYIQGATVKLYGLVNGQEQVIATTTTNNQGQYQFDKTLLSHATRIEASGGTDLSTGLGLPAHVTLTAPATASVVNPLTTLVQSYMQANPALSASQAVQQIKEALNISSSVDVLQVDPVAWANSDSSDGLNLQSKAAQIANVLVTGTLAVASGSGLTSEQAYNSVLNNLVTAIHDLGGSPIDLTSATVLSNVLGPQVPDNVTHLLAMGNDLTGSSNLAAIGEYQKVIQGDLAVVAQMGAAVDSHVFDQLDHLFNVVGNGQKIIDLDLAPGSDTGLSSTDHITNLASPAIRIGLSSISSVVAVGNTVKVMSGGISVFDETVSAADIQNGYMQFNFSDTDPQTHLPIQGPQALSVVVHDNVSDADIASGFLSIHIDTVAPMAELTLPVAGDNVINAQEAQNGVTLSGAVETGSQVSLTIGTQKFTPQVNDSQWTLNLTAADVAAIGDGPQKNIVISVTDVAGNTTVSNPYALAIDTLAPQLTLATPNEVVHGVVNLDEAVHGQVVLSGTVEAGIAQMQALVGAKAFGSPQCVVSGNDWTLTLGKQDLIDAMGGNLTGQVSAQIIATDAAGNATATTPTFFTVDLQPPALLDIGTADPLTHQSNLAVNLHLDSGTSVGDVVVLKEGDSVVATQAVQASDLINGMTVDLSQVANGVHNYVASISDAAGNSNVLDATLQVTVDSASNVTVAAVPTVNGAGYTTSFAVPASETVQVLTADGSDVTAQFGIQVDTINGVTTYTPLTGLFNGQTLTVNATAATDALGDVASTIGQTILVDTAAPNAPTSLTNAGPNTQSYATITGSAEPGSTVDIFDANVSTDGGLVATVTADAQTGHFKATVSGWVAGDNSLSAQAIDQAGNVSPLSSSIHVNFDASASSNTVTLTGTAIDGDVQGATVFYDPTGTGVFSSSYVTGMTDAQGRFILSGDIQITSVGRIVVMNGVDAMTGQSVGELLAPSGFGVISPLSTIMTLSGMSEADLKSSLGIDRSIDLSTFDPVSAMKNGASAADIAWGEQVFTKQQQIYSVLQSVAQLAADSASIDNAALNLAAHAVKTALSNAGANSDLSTVTHEAVTSVVNQWVSSGALNSSVADLTISAVCESVDNVVQSIGLNDAGLGHALNTMAHADSTTDTTSAESLVSQAQASAAISQTQLLSTVSGLMALAQSGTTDPQAFSTASLDASQVSASVSAQSGNFKALLDVYAASSGPGMPIYLLSNADAMIASNQTFIGSQVLLTSGLGTPDNPISLTEAHALLKHGLNFFHGDHSPVVVSFNDSDYLNLTADERGHLSDLMSSLQTSGAESFVVTGLTLDQNQYDAIRSVNATANGINLSSVSADHLAEMLSDAAVVQVDITGLTLDQGLYLNAQASGKANGGEITVTGVDADHMADMLNDPLVTQVDATDISLDQGLYLNVLASDKAVVHAITVTGVDTDHMAQWLVDPSVIQMDVTGLTMNQNQYLTVQTSGKASGGAITVTGVDADHITALLNDPHVLYIVGTELNSSQYLALQPNDGKVIGITVTGADGTLTQTLVSDPDVDNFSVASGTQIVIPYANISSLDHGYQKVLNPSDLNITVNNVPGNAVYSVVTRYSIIDHVTVQKGATISLAQSSWNYFQKYAGKVDFTGINVAITSVTASQAISIASDARVTSLTLAKAQEVDVPINQLDTDKAFLNKIQGNVVIQSADTIALSSTSLKELQQIGIDAVVVSAQPNAMTTDVNIQLGEVSGTLSNPLPLFRMSGSGQLNVTLDVANFAELDTVAHMSGLHGAAVSHVQINLGAEDLGTFLTGGNALLGAPTLRGEMNAIQAEGLSVSTVDLGAGQAVVINEDQAAALIQAGLHFASNDWVTLEAQGVMSPDGTQVSAVNLQNSLNGVQKLGVDATGHDINNLGIQALGLAGVSQLQDLNTLTSTLKDLGIDHLELQTSDLTTAGGQATALLTAFESNDWISHGVDVNLQIDEHLSTAAVSNGLSDNSALNALIEYGVGLAQGQTWGSWVNALTGAGLDRMDIESQASVHMGDDLSAVLWEAGLLHASPGSNIEIDALANTPLLSTSLKAMADLGVDMVHASGMVDVKLGLNANDLSSMQGLFTAFGLNIPSVVPHRLFDNNGNGVGLVLDDTTAQAMGMASGQIDESKVSSFVNQLSQLGITEVDVVHVSDVTNQGVDVYQINSVGANPAVTQTPILTAVELLGVNPEVSHAFDQDILSKNIQL
jgi:hypothetical protein